MPSYPIPTAGLNGADVLARDSFRRLEAQGGELLTTATGLLDEVASFAISSESINLEPPSSTIGRISARLLPRFYDEVLEVERPIDVTFDFDPDAYDPGALEIELPNAPAVPSGEPDAPGDPGESPNRNAPTAPMLNDYTAPTLIDPEHPQFGDYINGVVPDPEFIEIVLPPVPTINLDAIQFTATPPEYRGPEIDLAEFDFQEREYDALLIEQTQAVIERIFDGGSGLPVAVENALYEQARERETESGERAVEQARDEWAARGYRVPAGPLLKQISRAREEADKRISELARTQFIEFWRIQLEQLRFAVTSAIQLEELWLRKFISSEERRLQAARFRLDLAIAVVNAYVSRLNAEAIVYQTEAGVFKTRIEAELAKLQVYSEQIRGLQLIGELNEQQVRIYSERVRAVLANVEIYRANISAFEALLRANVSKVDVFRAQLQAETDKVTRFEAEIRAFNGLLQGDNQKLERFRTLAQLYGTKADVWKTKYDVNRDVFNAEVELQRLKRDEFAANMERVRALLETERTRVTSLLEKYRTQAEITKTAAEVDISEGELKLREYLATLEQAKSAADVAIKVGETNIQSALQAANIMLRAKETASTTYAQLAAGITSAASASASISGNGSYSFNVSAQDE